MNVLEVDSVILNLNSKPVLKDVYFKCETGKITGLLGRNGAGKSCLLKIIFGDLSADDQSIRINGKPVRPSSRASKDIRYLPQNRLIPKSLTIKQVFSDFELNFAEFVSAFPEFEPYYQSKLAHLSGGEQRLVEVYTILVSPSKFCLLDEPFSQIMPLHLETIQKLILRESKHKGVVITDHMYRQVVDISEDLYFILNGAVYRASGTEDLEALGYINEMAKEE